MKTYREQKMRTRSLQKGKQPKQRSLSNTAVNQQTPKTMWSQQTPVQKTWLFWHLEKVSSKLQQAHRPKKSTSSHPCCANQMGTCTAHDLRCTVYSTRHVSLLWLLSRRFLFLLFPPGGQLDLFFADCFTGSIDSNAEHSTIYRLRVRSSYVGLMCFGCAHMTWFKWIHMCGCLSICCSGVLVSFTWAFVDIELHWFCMGSGKLRIGFDMLFVGCHESDVCLTRMREVDADSGAVICEA